jgi:hypothetical protein
MILVGEDGTVREIDVQARRLLALDPADTAMPGWADLGLSDSVARPPAGRAMLCRRSAADGTWHWFLLSKRPLRLGGDPLYVFTLAEVSAIKNDLDKYRGFFRNAVEGILDRKSVV